MNYHFVCSERIVDIDEPKKWRKLYGDEVAELLCEDIGYWRWLIPRNIERMSGFDIATVLAVHPELLGHFWEKMKEQEVMEPEYWSYIFKFQPELVVLKEVISY